MADNETKKANSLSSLSKKSTIISKLFCLNEFMRFVKCFPLNF